MVIKQNRIFEYLGRSTLSVYLIHGTVISVMKIAFSKLCIPLLGGWLPMALCTAAGLLIPLGIYAVCKKVKALDFLFYPNKYIRYG